MKLEDDVVIHDWMGHAVGLRMGVFYLCDGTIWLRCPQWLQGAPNVLIGLFRRIDLMNNFTNSKIMTWWPGKIWSGMLEGAVGRRSAGKVDTYQERSTPPPPGFLIQINQGQD